MKTEDVLLNVKEIFDKKTALISTAILSVFYLHIFYSLRFMSEAPTLAFVTMGVYFFWKGYISKKAHECTCCSRKYWCYLCDDKKGKKYRNAAFIITAPFAINEPCGEFAW